MAVGKTGSFATTQAPVVDFGEMIRFAQQKQTEFFKTKRELDRQLKEDKDAFEDDLFSPDAVVYDFNSLNEVDGKLMATYGDELYKLKKDIEKAESQKDLGKLKGRALELERKGLAFKKQRQILEATNKDIQARIADGTISDGVDLRILDTLKLLSNGKELTSVSLDPASFDAVFEYKNGQKLTIDKVLQQASNIGDNIMLEDNVTRFATDFKAFDEKTLDGATKKSSTELLDRHYNEVSDWASSQIRNPKTTASAVFNATGLRGFNSIDKYVSYMQDIAKSTGAEEVPSAEEIVDNLEKTLTEKTFEGIANRMALSKGEERDTAYLNYLENRRKNISREGDEEEELTGYTGEETTPDPSLYFDVITEGTDVTEQPFDEEITRDDILQGKARSYAGQPITIESVEGYTDSQMQAIGNMSVSNAVLTKDGVLAISGSVVALEKAVQTQGKKGKNDKNQDTSISQRQETPEQRGVISVAIPKTNVTNKMLRDLGFTEQEVEAQENNKQESSGQGNSLIPPSAKQN